ncbi:MAG: hypothetical protein U0414_17015 [Polyangiaceae bacterium]
MRARSKWSVAPCLIVCAVATGSACGDPELVTPPPSPVPYYTSGTRLRAHVLDAGGGAVALQDWHDDALDTYCTIRKTDVGYRCVPYGSPTSLFNDPGCTVPVLVGAPPSDWIIVTTGDECGDEETYRVFKVGPAHPNAATYVRAGDGSCAPQTVDSSVAFDLTSAEDALEPMTTSTVRLGALDAIVARGEDGSSQVVRVEDHATGIRCVEAGGPTAANGVDACVPWNTQDDVEAYFTTPDCTGDDSGVFTCWSTECKSPSVAVHVDTEGCASSVSFVRVDPAPTQAYAMIDGAPCEAVTFGPCLFRASTTTVDPMTFPALAHARIGTGRIALDTLTPKGQATAVLELGTFADTTTKQACELKNVDELRCLPRTVDVNPGLSWYSDPACTTRVAPNFLGDALCGDQPTVALLRDQPDGTVVVAAPIKAIYALGAAVMADVYAFAGGVCANQGPRSIYELGAALDPTDFPAIEDRVE